MKKINFTLFLFLFILFGCTSTDDFQEKEKSHLKIQNCISKEEAICIADKVLNKESTTRTSEFGQISFDYIISNRSSRTRSSSTPDTLAYIINYPNEEGFVIVSTSKKVFPVLGFSDKGYFSYTNENAKLNFIDKIEEYTANTNTSVTYDANNLDFDACYFINPTVKTSISQDSPWNKYVIEEHPNCPAGCVAVATAIVLSHSMLELNYHGSTYHFKSIIEAINKEQDPDNSSPIYAEEEWNDAVQPTYTYDQAVDSMAKLLYWIGKDLNIQYTTTGSSAFSADAYALCKELKGDNELEYSEFDINAITWLIKKGYIIYLRGYDINGKGGHAWVSDGVGFCVARGESNGELWLNGERITETYIHCDWGWGGVSNGFYSGSVFEAYNYNFKPTNYFALRRGKNI